MSKSNLKEIPSITRHDSLLEDFKVAFEDQSKAFNKEANGLCSSMNGTANLIVKQLPRHCQSCKIADVLNLDKDIFTKFVKQSDEMAEEAIQKFNRLRAAPKAPKPPKSYPGNRLHKTNLGDKQLRFSADDAVNSVNSDGDQEILNSATNSAPATTLSTSNTLVRKSARLNGQQTTTRAFAVISTAIGSDKPVPNEFQSKQTKQRKPTVENAKSRSNSNSRFYYTTADGNMVELNRKIVAEMDEQSKQALKRLVKK